MSSTYINLYDVISEELNNFSDIANWKLSCQTSTSIPLSNIVVLGEHNPRYAQNILDNVLRYDISEEWVHSIFKYGIINPIAGFFVLGEDEEEYFMTVDGYRRIIASHIIRHLEGSQEYIDLPVYSISKWLNWGNKANILTQMLDVQDVIHVRQDFGENRRLHRMRELLHRGIKQKDIASQLNMTTSQVSMWKHAALDTECYRKIMFEGCSVDRAIKEKKAREKEEKEKQIQVFLEGESGSDVTPTAYPSISPFTEDIPPTDILLTPSMEVMQVTEPEPSDYIQEVYNHITSKEDFEYVSKLLLKGTQWFNILTNLKLWQDREY